jgi:hypothetical protein
MMPKFRWQLPPEERAHYLNSTLAERLGRPDTAGYNPPTIMDPYSNPMIAAGAIQAAMNPLDSGRISAGMIGVLVLAAAGFYLWTRRFQS